MILKPPFRLVPTGEAPHDWGYIKDADGNLLCRLNVNWFEEEELQKHRRDKTDPTAETALEVIGLLNENAAARAFINALTVQATPGTDYYCPFCDRHDKDLDGRLILDPKDSQEAREYTK